MIGLALYGAALGALLFAIIWKVIPPKPSPLVQLGRFELRQGSGGAGRAATPVGGGWQERTQGRLGRVAADWLERRGVAYTSLRQDLALTGRSFESVLGRKLGVFLAGFLLVVMTAAALRIATGISAPGGSAVLIALLVGAGFFFLPDLEARREAAARRRDFRRALGAYLDLVALEMAGSAAPTEALPSAARVGSGWPMALLRDTLWRSTRSGQDPWDALTELGQRIGVGELRDLGNLVRLTGRDGARVRQTLTSRAATMRAAALAEAEGAAGQRDQSMRLAQLVIGFGFVAFLTYPAVINVLGI